MRGHSGRVCGRAGERGPFADWLGVNNQSDDAQTLSGNAPRTTPYASLANAVSTCE
ncbi:hypothetical protein [Cerasicoccus frondis]|uniref:hypothetical protein n=1 Tax=Cerasicoccus frondis TaxID=490090 RepID=UPI0028527B04|nr:hypothetical protein [Cerasicoccus frondis]